MTLSIQYFFSFAKQKNGPASVICDAEYSMNVFQKIIKENAPASAVGDAKHSVRARCLEPPKGRIHSSFVYT